MYVLNKYEYGYRAYKRGFNDGCNPQSKSLSNELRCITYYLKKEGKSLEEVNSYMNKQLKTIYSFIRDNDLYISHRLRMVEREYNLEDVKISFCKNEVDFLKQYKKNEARIIFYIMCLYKMYKKRNIHLINGAIRQVYNNCIDPKTIDKVIYKLNTDGIVQSKMTHSRNGDVRFVTTISEKITELYDGNDVCVLNNVGNIKLLFDYVVGNNKNVILCAKCGVVVEKTVHNKKYCDNCAHEIKQEKTKKTVYNSRKEVRVGK